MVRLSRLRPRGRVGTPTSSSPRTIIRRLSRQAPTWLVHAGRWRRPGRSSESRRLDIAGCLATIDGLEPILNRTSEQQLDEAFVAPPLLTLQAIFTAIDSFDLEFLPGLDLVFLPDFGGKKDLTFRRNDGFHSW